MWRLALVILAVVCVLLFLFVLWLPSRVVNGTRMTLDESFNRQSGFYDTSFYQSLHKTAYTVKGFGGYLLHVVLLENPMPTTEYVILTHGYTDNRMGALKYVPMYLRLGYNCIVYDLRGHGENKKTFTTYGVRESLDLDCLVKDTRERYAGLTSLGLHGESLGAATTVMCMKYKPKVDFAVADCGFSDIENVLRDIYRNAHMPAFLLGLTSIGAKLRYGHSMKEMRPIDSLKENDIPILFLHGAEDTFILPKNSEDMAKRTRGRAQYHVIPGARHAESILAAQETYERIVKEFLGG